MRVTGWRRCRGGVVEERGHGQAHLADRVEVVEQGQVAEPLEVEQPGRELVF